MYTNQVLLLTRALDFIYIMAHLQFSSVKVQFIGFEYLETRENVLDRVKAFLYAKSSKLTTLRGEDLYGMLAEGPLNNTLIQVRF